MCFPIIFSNYAKSLPSAENNRRKPIPTPSVPKKLNLPYFLARKIMRSPGGSFPRLVRRVAVFNVTVGLIGTLLAFCILRGFEYQITKKIQDIVGHIHISGYAAAGERSTLSLKENRGLEHLQKKHRDIAVLSPFLYATAMLEGENDRLGAAIKGVTSAYTRTAFPEHLVAGTLPDFHEKKYSRACVISEKMAQILGKKLGDTLVASFLQVPPRQQPLTIVGIYNTHMLQEFDEKIVLADLRLVQKIHRLAADEVEGIEIFLEDHEQTDRFYHDMVKVLNGSRLYPEKVKNKYPYVFDWLLLIRNNALVFVALILLVSCFNMISSFLILTMERYRMIGLLKALGGQNTLIRRVFFHYATLLIAKGMFWGNALAFLLTGVQHHFKLIRLDPSSYSLPYLPIAWEPQSLLLGNLLVFLFLQLAVRVPVHIASRQPPGRTIPFH